MSMIECSCCHCFADVRSFRCCSDCGAPLCDDCANISGGRCYDCSAKDT